MTEHPQNSPGSYTEEQNIGSPEAGMASELSEDCCIKTEPREDSAAPGTSFQGDIKFYDYPIFEYC